MLLRRIVGIAKELLLHAHVASADDVFAVLPDAVPEGLLLDGRVGARGRRRPVAGGCGAVPAIHASGSAATRAAKSASATRVTAPAFISAAGGRRGTITGASPAVPAASKSQLTNQMWENTIADSLFRKSRIRGSPLHIAEMRRNISRFTETEGLCGVESLSENRFLGGTADKGHTELGFHASCAVYRAI